MPDDLRHLDKIAASMRGATRRYADVVRADLAPTLKSLVMFGPVVGGPFAREADSAQSVIVLGKVDLGALRRLADHGESLGRDGIAAPVVMTPEYILASLDTFPLELIAIQQRHVTLWGDEHFQDLVFEDSFVRLQCEREFKRLLMGMRQALLDSTGRTKFIGAFERDAADTLLRSLHGLVWLRGERQPLRPPEVVDHAERQFKQKLPGLRKALDDNAYLGWKEFDELYRDVESLGEMINAG